MAGSLINSGTLDVYKPLGEEGHPVYSVAPQLREIIRIRVSPGAANCLAIPKINEDHSVIDWYAAEAGNVVPWSAATETERAFALENLDKIRTDVNSALATLSGISAQEKRTIEKLRDKIFTHPDNTCVSLVNGKAVLSFWGFYTNEAPPADPFLKLRPVAATPSPNIEAPKTTAANAAFTANQANDPVSVEKTTGRPWWLWLLIGLLALLLLLFVLRGCAPSLGLPSLSLPSFDSPTTTTVTPMPDTTTSDHSASVNIDKSTGNLDLNLGTQGSSGSIDLVVPALPDVNLALPGMPDVNIETTPNGSTDTVVDPAIPESSNTDTLLPDGKAVTEDSLNTALSNAEQSDSSTAIPQMETLSGTQPTSENPSAQASPLEPQTPNSPVDPPNSGANPPVSATIPGPGGLMQIPSGAAQSGSVSFMDGRWRASGGIQDAKTGQPVRLFYDFKDGKGSVTVEKGDGVRCRAAAQSMMSDGNLVISNEGDTAQCSDGSTLALPTISCTSSANGQANCTGAAKDGTPLPIIIRQQP